MERELPPIDWAEQLKQAYPKRSGPSGWGSSKLMYVLRAALFESTWQEIMDGIKSYKSYCDASGKTGTDYVQNPLRFIQDKCYQETYGYQAPEDPKVTEHKRQEALRWAKARTTAQALDVPLLPHQNECVAAFETRIRTAQTDGAPRASVRNDGELARRISSLADRMRMAK